MTDFKEKEKDAFSAFGINIEDIKKASERSLANPKQSLPKKEIPKRINFFSKKVFPD